jgi:hypothetical protein
MSPIPSSLRSTEAPDVRSPGDRNLGADLDNIFRLAGGLDRPKAPAPVPASAPRRMTQPDLDAALDMLNRAAKAMDLLQSRYQHVESYAKDVAERAERDLALAFSQAKDWEGRASEGEARIEDAKARLAEAERRAESAERRAELGEHRADEAERRASHAEHRADHAERSANEAREWLECFYDKIVASFDTRPILKTAAA